MTYLFEILSDLNQAVPIHLADESLTRLPDTPPDHLQKSLFRVGGLQSSFSMSSFFIVFFVLLPFFLKTKIKII